MAIPRVTQQFLENIRGDQARVASKARISQQFAEVIRSINVALPAIRVTQQFLETIASSIPVLHGVNGDIAQTLPFLEQTLIVGATAVIHLPNAAELRPNGARWKYRFYATNHTGMVIQAWPGNTVRIGPDEGTKITCNTAGNYLELFAVDDAHVVASIELPQGTWVVT